MGQERRQHPRFDVSIRVRFADLEALQEETTRNLSRGGCMVTSRTIRPLNSRFPLTLVHPSSSETLEIPVEVKRVAAMPDGSWALGVEFVDFTPALSTRIRNFVDSVTVPAGSAVPAAPGTEAASTLAGTRLAGYLSKAEAAEAIEDLDEALRCLDLALALSPELAKAHAHRARLTAEHRKDFRLAASHAGRAAELEPSNEAYRTMAEEYALESSTTPEEARRTAAAASTARPEAARPKLRQDRVPGRAGRRQWLLTGASVAVGGAFAGYNVWRLLLRDRGKIHRLDPEPFRELVPLSELRLANGRAYGVVTPEWPSIADPETRLSGLAARLRAHGAGEVVLQDGEAKLVAIWRNDRATIYPSVRPL